MNADTYVADEEWHSIDFWTSTQSVVVVCRMLPNLLIMTLMTKITINCRVNSVI